MDGVLIVDKPGGITSHDVVSRIRKLAGQKRVGHAGTLDPAATGVLVVLLGRATKISDLLLNSDKSYEGVFVFGAETDTCDADGKIISEKSAEELSEEIIKQAAMKYLGDIMQVPPAYSAIKIGGRAMYKLAREGKSQPEIEPRAIKIYDFCITSFLPGTLAEAGFRVSCSKGTYIRSLASDIGRDVGTGGYLKELRRTGAGPFSITGAIPLDDLNETVIKKNIIGIASGLSGLPQVSVDEAEAARVMNGFGLTESGLTAKLGENVAVLDSNGLVLAVHEIIGDGLTKPIRVIGEGRL